MYVWYLLFRHQSSYQTTVIFPSIYVVSGLDVATCGVASATRFSPLATNFWRMVASLATWISSYYFISVMFSFPEIHDEINDCYHRFRWYATLENKTPAETFPKLPSVLTYALSTDWIEIRQSQPLVWPSALLYVVLAGCDWWISMQYVDNT